MASFDGLRTGGAQGRSSASRYSRGIGLMAQGAGKKAGRRPAAPELSVIGCQLSVSPATGQASHDLIDQSVSDLKAAKLEGDVARRSA